jgi:hypothetical protein
MLAMRYGLRIAAAVSFGVPRPSSTDCQTTPCRAEETRTISPLAAVSPAKSAVTASWSAPVTASGRWPVSGVVMAHATSSVQAVKAARRGIGGMPEA